MRDGLAQVGLDVVTGGIASLRTPGGDEWASDSKLMASLVYQTLNDSDWKPFTYDYINDHSESGGFCKPNSNNYTESKHWRTTLKAAWADGATTVVAELSFEDRAVKLCVCEQSS